MAEQRLIDANALENELKEYASLIALCERPEIAGGILRCLDSVKAAPTVDAKLVVHGRWIEYENGVIVCSECGEEHSWDEYRATYCEDCGAKMDGGTE